MSKVCAENSEPSEVDGRVQGLCRELRAEVDGPVQGLEVSPTKPFSSGDAVFKQRGCGLFAKPFAEPEDVEPFASSSSSDAVSSTSI